MKIEKVIHTSTGELVLDEDVYVTVGNRFILTEEEAISQGKTLGYVYGVTEKSVAETSRCPDDQVILVTHPGESFSFSKRLFRKRDLIQVSSGTPTGNRK